MREDLSVVRNPGSTEAGLGLGTRVDIHVMNAAVVGRGRSSRGARGCLTPRLRSRSITRNKQYLSSYISTSFVLIFDIKSFALRCFRLQNINNVCIILESNDVVILTHFRLISSSRKHIIMTSLDNLSSNNLLT